MNPIFNVKTSNFQFITFSFDFNYIFLSNLRSACKRLDDVTIAWIFFSICENCICDNFTAYEDIILLKWIFTTENEINDNEYLY